MIFYFAQTGAAVRNDPTRRFPRSDLICYLERKRAQTRTPATEGAEMHAKAARSGDGAVLFDYPEYDALPDADRAEVDALVSGVRVAAGEATEVDAVMPFDIAKRVAFHSLVAKLR